MIDFPIPIVMVIVGSIYIMPENCKINHAPIYLLVGGTVYILCAIFRYSMLMRCKCCKPCTKLLGRGVLKTAAKMLAWEFFWNLGILIWGTIDVAGFNSIGRVQSHDPTRDDYCHQVPYAFAFVLIVVGWLTYGIIGAFFCCAESSFLIGKYKKKGCCGKKKKKKIRTTRGREIIAGARIEDNSHSSDAEFAANFLGQDRRQPPKWKDWPPPPSCEDAAGVNPASDDPVIGMPGARDRDLEMAPVMD